MKPTLLNASDDLDFQLTMLEVIVIPHIKMIIEMHKELLARVSINDNTGSAPTTPSRKHQGPTLSDLHFAQQFNRSFGSEELTISPIKNKLESKTKTIKTKPKSSENKYRLYKTSKKIMSHHANSAEPRTIYAKII